MRTAPFIWNRRWPLCAGFTLVELLVTIAIMAILVGLLAPSLARARAAAQRTACLSRLQQWALSMHLYTEEHQGAIPRESFGQGTALNFWAKVAEEGNGDLWFNALPPAHSGRPVSNYSYPTVHRAKFYAHNSLFHCPSARFPPRPELEPWPLFSLAMNSQLYHADRPVFAQELCRASQTVMFMDNLLPNELRFDQGQADFSLGQPSASPYRFSIRHRRTGNLIFWDGHAASFKGEEVVETRPGPNRGDIIFPEEKIVWNICPP